MGYSETITGIYCDTRGCTNRLNFTPPEIGERPYFAAREEIENRAKRRGWSAWVGTPRSGLGRRREFCPQHGPADPSKARRIW